MYVRRLKGDSVDFGKLLPMVPTCPSHVDCKIQLESEEIKIFSVCISIG